jgi:hypothetical protein
VAGGKGRALAQGGGGFAPGEQAKAMGAHPFDQRLATASGEAWLSRPSLK